MLRFAMIALLFPALALAQTETTPPADAQPKTVGARHICTVHPVDASVRVIYRIATDGTIRNLTVADSSGNPGLDADALSCAARWQYAPAMLGGQPVEVDWGAFINWNNGPAVAANLMAPPTSVGPAHACIAHKQSAGTTTTPGTVNITYNVDTDGAVVDVAVQQSSGDKDYDAYAVSCVSAWQFRPARRGDTPIEMSQTTQIAWNNSP